MSIFEWFGVDFEDLIGASSFIHGLGDVATSRIAKEQLHRGTQPDEEDIGRLARTRWLEANHAESSFPCGVVPDPDPPSEEPRLNVVPMLRRVPIQVIAALLPFELVFLLDRNGEDVVEVGRLPRKAIREVDVIDRAGVHVPEPANETFEPDALALVVLRWSNDGVDDEERFAFRSTWLAWRAAHTLRDARQG